MDLSLISSIAEATPQLTAQFNKKFQANQLAIAEANAREAEAMRPPLSEPTNWLPIIVVSIVILGIVILVTKKRAR